MLPILKQLITKGLQRLFGQQSRLWLSEAGEGRNITHNQKKLNHDELLYFRDRFNVPLTDKEASTTTLSVSEDSEEYQYLVGRRKKLGGSLPYRNQKASKLTIRLFQFFKRC